MASPSDVGEEREAIRRVGESLNTVLRQAVPIRVAVVGWEQSRPAFGRPQAVLNPMVESCDLFVGILNRRWGSETGVRSSGFEEEFELALQRRQAGADPEIFMYFHSLSQDLLDDPGAELQKVLSFKDRVRAEKLLLYRTYQNVEDLELQMHQHLLSLILDRAQLDITRGSESTSSAEPNTEAIAGSDAESVDEAGTQVIEVFEEYTALLRRERKAEALPLNSARLLLFAEAFTRDAPLLDGHLANRLYRSADLVLTTGEHHHWSRSLLADLGSAESTGQARSVPGWKHLLPLDIAEDVLLEDIADLTNDGNLRIARGALLFLTEARARPQLFWRDLSEESASAIATAWIRLLRPNLLATALRYIFTVASPTDIGLLEQLAAVLEGDASKVAAAVARAQLGDFNPLAELVGVSAALSPWLATTLTDRTVQLGDDELNALVANRWDAPLSTWALRQLMARNGCDCGGTYAGGVGATAGRTDDEGAGEAMLSATATTVARFCFLTHFASQPIAHPSHKPIATSYGHRDTRRVLEFGMSDVRTPRRKSKDDHFTHTRQLGAGSQAHQSGLPP